MSGFEVFTETVSESICEYNVRSMQKGEGAEGAADDARELLILANRLRAGQALVIVKKGNR